MIRRKHLPIMVAFIILLSGCSAQSAATTVQPLPTDDGATEITIEVWDVSGFYQSAALKFEKETGVNVNISNTFKSGLSFQEDIGANKERIQAELMAGKGADVYAGIYLDFSDIGKNKHLCNLADWIAQDPSFSDKTYYMNIFKSGFDEGDVYSVPLFMMFNALGSTIETPQLDGQNLSWEDFFELTKNIKRSGVLYGITDYELFRRRFEERYDVFINEEKETQNLESPEMASLLEQCKEWSTEGLCISYNIQDQNNIFDSAFFTEYGGGDMYMLTNFRFDNPYLNDEPYFYDIPSDSGKNDKVNKIAPSDYICINAASPNKGTAWEFAKFLLREDIQATGFFTPINRKASEEHISKMLNETIEYFELDVDSDQVIEECKAILNAVDKVPYGIHLTDIEEIVYKEAKRFFTNDISAEEASKNMASGVTLYFKEQ